MPLIGRWGRSRLFVLPFYIGGLNIEETAEVLDISPATVQREWRAAKAWRYRAIREGEANEGIVNQGGRDK